MSAHTPGPWTRIGYSVTRGTGMPQITVAWCGKDTGEGPYKPLEESECVANARLIAAAPALLEALERIAKQPEPQHPTGTWARDVAREAIAKAKGKASTTEHEPDCDPRDGLPYDGRP